MTQSPYSHVLLITGSRTWAEKTSITSDYSIQSYLDRTYDAIGKIWAYWAAASATPVTKPLLISGHCPKGADTLLEKIWSNSGYDYVPMPADWDTLGNRAGYLRNEAMVREALAYQSMGAQIAAAAFIDVCGKTTCNQRENEQLMPGQPGHWSHGTMHCRNAALKAGIPVLDVLAPPPF